jgi:hypothetical protein
MKPTNPFADNFSDINESVKFTLITLSDGWRLKEVSCLFDMPCGDINSDSEWIFLRPRELK